MKWSWIIQGPLNPAAILRTDKREATNTEEKTMRGQNQTRVMKPQAKECLGPREAGRGKDRFSPWGLEGNAGLLTPWRQTSGPLGRIHFCALGHPSSWCFFAAVPENESTGSCGCKRYEQSRGASAKLTWKWVCQNRAVTSHPAGRGAALWLSESPCRGCLVCGWPCPVGQLQDFLLPHPSWTVNLNEENEDNMRYCCSFQRQGKAAWELGRLWVSSPPTSCSVMTWPL